MPSQRWRAEETSWQFSLVSWSDDHLRLPSSCLNDSPVPWAPSPTALQVPAELVCPAGTQIDVLPRSLSEARITLKPRTEKVSVRKDNLEPVSLMNMDTKILNKH